MTESASAGFSLNTSLILEGGSVNDWPAVGSLRTSFACAMRDAGRATTASVASSDIIQLLFFL
jgi:hypothetical protein